MPNSFILHIDMNSYFASVEQQANPLFRNKPIGVCAYLSPNGFIIASSKEAKQLGIKTGCQVKEAQKIYPGIILVENDPIKYRSITEKIFTIFSDYTSRIEPYSIDEAFLDLTGYINNYKQGENIILEIKKRIKEDVGDWLTCSAGLSWTRFLAKFASDITEANNHQIIDSIEKAICIYQKVEMREAWGIAKRLERRLNQLGIHNLLDLKNYPIINLMQAFGKPGYYLWANVNGIEIEGVRTKTEQNPRSIGHSYCVSKQEPNMTYLKAVLMKLCEKTGRSLRQKGLEASTIWTGYRLKYGGEFFKRKKIPDSLHTTQDIFKAALDIFLLNPPKEKIHMIGISVYGLKPLSNQLNLFNNNYKIKTNKISRALDKINSKFGEFTIYNGSMWDMSNQAQDRIGFRKSVNIKEKVEDVRYI